MTCPLVAVVDNMPIDWFVMEANIHFSIKNRWVTGAQSADPTQKVELILVGATFRMDTSVDEIMCYDVWLLTHIAPRNVVLGQTLNIGSILSYKLMAFRTFN